MDENLITPSDYFHRGLDHLEKGEYESALDYFREAREREYRGADLELATGEALFELGRYEDALAQFNQAREVDGVAAEEVLIWKGSCYIELGKLHRAVSAFNRVISLNPQHAEAHFKRGLVLTEMGSPDRALKAFDTSLALVSDEAEAAAEIKLWKGRALMRLGRRSEGLELLHEAHEQAPHMPGPYNEIADAQRQAGDLAKAEEWYRRGLEALPEDPSLYNDYGNLLRDLGRYDDSLKYLTFAAEHDSNRTVAYYNRALTLERLGRGDDARKDYEAVIHANPGDLDARLRHADLLAHMGLFADARQALAELPEEDRRTPEVSEALARVAAREAQRAELEGDADRAVACYVEALSLHPDFLDVESPAGADDTTEDRLNRIAALLAGIAPEHPFRTTALVVMGAALYKLQRVDEAEAALRQVVEETAFVGEEDRSLPASLRALGLVLLAEISYYERGRDDEALKPANEALKIRPDFLRAHWISAVVLNEGLGRPAEAAAAYRRMLEITPQNAAVLLHLGDLYFDHGQPHRALECYRRVLEERPGDPGVNRDIGLCYLALQRFGEAIACFSRLDTPGSPVLEIRLDLAEAHLAVGDRAEAAALIESVREADAGLDPAIQTRCAELSAALALARRKPDAALRELETVDRERLTTYGLLQSGRALLLLERLTEAERDLREIIEEQDPRTPDAVEARYHLARLLFARQAETEKTPSTKRKKNEMQAPLPVVDELLAVAPFDQRAWRLKAWLQMLEGDLEGSEETEQARRFAELVARCYRLLQHEEFSEARQCALDLASDYPSRLEPRYYLACAVAQLGEEEEALEEVRAMVKQDPSLRERVLDEFYLEPLRLADRLEFRA